MTFRELSLYLISRHLLIGIVSICMLSYIQFAQSQNIALEGWELVKNKNGIKIYTRQMQDSKLKEFKAYTTLKADIEKVVWVLQDIDNYDKWTVNVKNSSLLKKINNNEFYVYSEVHLSWPFSDRDIINHVIFSRPHLNDTAIVEIIGMPYYIPTKEGIIRIPTSKGKWYIYPFDNEHVQIEYTYGADPGGSIPAWIVNMFIVDGPYKTLRMLKEYVKTEE